jgi:hypothetical protein
MATEGVTIQYLLNLKERLREQGSDCKALDTFFAEGADLMAREAYIVQLHNLTIRLKQHLEEAVLNEDGAQYASLAGDAVSSISGLIVKGIGSAIGGHPWSSEAFEKDLTGRRARKQRTFGMIMVCIGKGGLPDDVHIVSVSEKARTQNRSESTIILEIQQSGALLFAPDKFMQLIEELVRDIRKGKSRLPILPEQLPVKLVPVKRPSLNIKRIDA